MAQWRSKNSLRFVSVPFFFFFFSSFLHLLVRKARDGPSLQVSTRRTHYNDARATDLSSRVILTVDHLEGQTRTRDLVRGEPSSQGLSLSQSLTRLGLLWCVSVITFPSLSLVCLLPRHPQRLGLISANEKEKEKNVARDAQRSKTEAGGLDS